MRRSKVDRIGEVFERAIRQAIDDVRLTEVDANNHSTAEGLKKLRDRISSRAKYIVTGDTYTRLEVSDIIRGHKRAWPES